MLLVAMYTGQTSIEQNSKKMANTAGTQHSTALFSGTPQSMVCKLTHQSHRHSVVRTRLGHSGLMEYAWMVGMDREGTRHSNRCN
jgi:hypothetical protein